MYRFIKNGLAFEAPRLVFYGPSRETLLQILLPFFLPVTNGMQTYAVTKKAQ